MANRGNHYEAAFEAFLRERRLPYVCVDETRKALFSGSNLKSFDFVVYSRSGPNLLVDIKGRKALGGADATSGGGSLQTWATRQDVEDLARWEQIFGEDFRAIFAFVFWIDPVLAPGPGHYVWRLPGQGTQPPAPAGLGGPSERHYLMLAVGLSDYRSHMSRRSEKWDTVAMPLAEFRQLSRPILDWL